MSMRGAVLKRAFSGFRFLSERLAKSGGGVCP
jgi:hypothetical protein